MKIEATVKFKHGYIVEFINKHNITLKELSEKANVKYTTLNNFVNLRLMVRNNEFRDNLFAAMKSLQQDVEWQNKNFPNNKNYHCLLGLVEEVGELSHSFLKHEQGIRTNENHFEKISDAIGDTVIYLAGFCNANGFDLKGCVETAWSEVKNRNWTKNKVDGVTK